MQLKDDFPWSSIKRWLMTQCESTEEAFSWISGMKDRFNFGQFQAILAAPVPDGMGMPLGMEMRIRWAELDKHSKGQVDYDRFEAMIGTWNDDDLWEVDKVGSEMKLANAHVTPTFGHLDGDVEGVPAFSPGVRFRSRHSTCAVSRVDTESSDGQTRRVRANSNDTFVSQMTHQMTQMTAVSRNISLASGKSLVRLPTSPNRRRSGRVVGPRSLDDQFAERVAVKVSARFEARFDQLARRFERSLERLVSSQSSRSNHA
jgi:hypothetical protein